MPVDKIGNQIFDEDYALLILSVEVLERYLLANELYWPLFIHPKMKLVNPRSRLTPGNLLLSVQRLSSIALDEELQQKKEASLSSFREICQTWKTHWQKKCLLEFDARMDLWTAFVRDLLSEQDSHAINYNYALRWRVILHLLNKERIKPDESMVMALQAMDENIRAITEPSTFAWCMDCVSSFPSDEYWFLYRKIKV